ncbi:hypothetical protein FLONG3_2107 [Fusarium longipes]|uniref:Glycan binding protein Y3-like domain-containing protein n=1 Tax=Fusarium longipes TaxID=694270 RepID=A0A395T4X0_9HYPO|nr:hypothetical protein FLONG3_2107 [Fusarium longipes]
MQITSLFTILSAVSMTIANPLPDSSKHDVSQTGFRFKDVSENKANLIKRQNRYCYQSGSYFGDNTDYAIDRAGRWCSGNGGSGKYRQGQQKKACYNYYQPDNNHKIVFEMQNTQAKDYTLSSEECQIWLQHMIENCRQGGTNHNSRFKWRVDPGSGRC